MNEEFGTNPLDNIPSEPVTPPQDITNTPAFTYNAPEVTIPETPSTVDSVPTFEQVQQPASSFQSPTFGQAQQPASPFQSPTFEQAQQPASPYQSPTFGQAQQPTPNQAPTNGQQQTYSQTPYQYTPVNTVYAEDSAKDNYAIASLVLGIVGAVTCCIGVPSLLAVIFGIMSLVKNKNISKYKGLAIAGIVLGAWGLISFISVWFSQSGNL